MEEEIIAASVSSRTKQLMQMVNTKYAMRKTPRGIVLPSNELKLCSNRLDNVDSDTQWDGVPMTSENHLSFCHHENVQVLPLPPGIVLPNNELKLHSNLLDNVDSATQWDGVPTTSENTQSICHGEKFKLLSSVPGNIENDLLPVSVNAESDGTSDYNLQELQSCSTEYENIDYQEESNLDDTDNDSDFVCSTDCSSSSNEYSVTKKSKVNNSVNNSVQGNPSSYIVSGVDVGQHTPVITGINDDNNDNSYDMFDVTEKINPISSRSVHNPGEKTNLLVDNRIRSAKGEGKFCRKKRRERKMKRNTGQEYVSTSGKVVKARALKQLKVCRMQCKNKLEQVRDGKTIQESILNEYWALGDRDRRVSYIAGLVESKPPKTCRVRTHDPENQKNRKVANYFHFKINGEAVNVCRKCFSDTLCETNMFITQVMKNRGSSTSGVVHTDNRGKKPSVNKTSDKKIQEVVDHINSFPLYESHYTRRRSGRKYLPSHYTLQLLYRLYLEKYPDNPVSRTIYEREFRKLNIYFKMPKFDTCHKCDILNLQKRMAKDPEELQNTECELKIHHEAADEAYLSKSNDKESAKKNKYLRCFCFDLQQCLPTPYLNTSVAFYKRQLWTFDLTINDIGQDGVNCYMWHECEGARGANQIATCIYKEMMSLPPEVKHVILYSDTCGGQNRNSHMAAMFFKVMQDNENLETIDHKFMVSGHSHLECDVTHGIIEKKKKKHEVSIYHPHDWYQLVRSAGKKTRFVVTELTHPDFMDYANLLKTSLQLRKSDTDGEPFSWLKARWFRYTKDYGVVSFKNTLHEEESFKSLSFIRRGQPHVIPPTKCCYQASLPITSEKKNDLMDLLPLVPGIFHNFYKSLKTSSTVKDTLPDVEEHCDDNEH